MKNKTRNDAFDRIMRAKFGYLAADPDDPGSEFLDGLENGLQKWIEEIREFRAANPDPEVTP